MYQILYTNNFRKQLRKILKSGKNISEEITSIIDVLASGNPLQENLHNHRLQGKYKNMFECHIRPNVLLVYEKDEENKIIIFKALGSHTELFK